MIKEACRRLHSGEAYLVCRRTGAQEQQVELTVQHARAAKNVSSEEQMAQPQARLGGSTADGMNQQRITFIAARYVTLLHQAHYL